ncbi:hypothetical protein AGMMS49574_22240 [Bacteroidia bacterium]|nr:hypothetical protein AGMMS49574_22240 [Bacteroidia bacterium]
MFGESINDCYNIGDVSVFSSPETTSHRDGNYADTAGGICGYASDISNCP